MILPVEYRYSISSLLSFHTSQFRNQVIKATEYYDDRDDDSTVWYKTLVPKYRRLPPHELPQGATLGFTYQTMTVNPAVFLPWLKADLDTHGVRFIRKEVSSVAEAKRIAGCDIIVHASGLGASDLADDMDVVAARGQTIFVASDFDELVILQGSQYTYIIPRMYTGGVIVGGVSQEGNMNRGVDENLRDDILERVKKMSQGRLGAVDLKKASTRDIVAFRPGRTGGYRIEAEGNVVHAYGFGSLGYIYSYGAALKVRQLVDSLTTAKRTFKGKL